jgi:hypothetical protein
LAKVKLSFDQKSPSKIIHEIVFDAAYKASQSINVVDPSKTSDVKTIAAAKEAAKLDTPFKAIVSRD